MTTKAFILLMSLCGLFSASILAQRTDGKLIIPIDSSYTVAHEWVTNHKKYSFISVVGLGDTTQLAINNNIVYTHYGKRKLHLDVAQPHISNSERQPVVLIIHAGGWCSGNQSMDRTIAYELVRHGFATVCPEYRMSPEAKYPAAVRDVETSLRWIRANAKQYHFDSNRIAILGSSAGGQLAALVGSLNAPYLPFETNAYKNFSVHVNAVVDMDGVLAFIGHGSGEGQDKLGQLSCATRWFGVSMKIDQAPYLQASALTHVNPHSAPILFVNSSVTRMHAGRDAMIDKLNQYGIYSEIHEIPNTPHTYWLFHPWFDEAMRYTIAFLNRELKKAR